MEVLQRQAMRILFEFEDYAANTTTSLTSELSPFVANFCRNSFVTEMSRTMYLAYTLSVIPGKRNSEITQSLQNLREYETPRNLKKSFKPYTACDAFNSTFSTTNFLLRTFEAEYYVQMCIVL